MSQLGSRVPRTEPSKRAKPFKMDGFQKNVKRKPAEPLLSDTSEFLAYPPPDHLGVTLKDVANHILEASLSLVTPWREVACPSGNKAI